MLLLPYERISYRTRLSEAEVLRRLQQKTGAKGAGNTFEGEIAGNQFALSLVMPGRSTFSPRISGSVVRDGDTTVIHVQMRILPVSIVMLLVWCVFVLYLILPSDTFTNGPLRDQLSPLLMVLFAYGIMMVGFKPGSIKARKVLAELLEAEGK